MRISKKIMSVLVWLVVVLVIWQGVSFLLANVIKDPLADKKVPSILTITSLFLEYGTELLKQAQVTVSYALIGLIIGSIVGILLALIMSLSLFLEKMIQPYLLISQMIPILGLAPIILGLFKDITISRIVIAAYITFFPVALNLLSGLKSAEENLIFMMHSYAANKYQLYSKYLLPHSLPYLFTGLKISAPMAVTASILVDTLSAKDGIGYVIIYTLYGGGTVGQFWPALIIAALIGVLSFLIITLLEYILVPWKRNVQGR